MFEELDTMEHLKVRTEPGGRRVTTGGRNDAITDLLGACQLPSQLAALARRFGLSVGEIRLKAERASGFGQFRMAVGNRIRGIVRRIDRSRRRGRSLSLAEAACRGRIAKTVAWRNPPEFALSAAEEI